jgi:hypothetical protein
VGIEGRRIRGLAALGAIALTSTGPTALARARTPLAVSVSVSKSAVSAAIRPGFVGLSMEFSAVRAYTGRNPSAINPVLLQLIRNLAPRGSPVLRIGGDSTDASWWPVSGITPPPGVNYSLTNGWMRSTRALAADLRARLILGVNLEANNPRIASAEADAFIQRIGRRHIAGLEIGNEPDLYPQDPWYALPNGQRIFGRSSNYSLQSLISQFSRWRSALPALPVVGPALATVPWMNELGEFLSAEPAVRLATVHRYPLSSCEGDRGAADYPTIDHLISKFATVGLASPLSRYVAIAHSHGAQLRVAEMNSTSCRGRWGVSNTFASALWVLDTLFECARAGVVGVNVHTLPGAAYELFTFSRTRRGWLAFVRPEYYGLQLFAQAAPPGSHLVAVRASRGPVKAWATRGRGGTIRVVLINFDRRAARLVYVRVPRPGGFARVVLLRASGLRATNGVTLGGRTYGDRTGTGRLRGTSRVTALFPVNYGDLYTVSLPPASAAMLTR